MAEVCVICNTNGGNTICAKHEPRARQLLASLQQEVDWGVLDPEDKTYGPALGYRVLRALLSK